MPVEGIEGLSTRKAFDSITPSIKELLDSRFRGNDMIYKSNMGR